MRYEEEISRTANRTRLYGTRSRTDSLNTLTATQLIPRMLRLRTGTRSVTDFSHSTYEEVFQGVANGVQRHEGGTRRHHVGQDTLGRRIERQLQCVAPRRDLRFPLNLTTKSIHDLGAQVRDDELPPANLERE